MTFVLDACVAVAWCFADESTPATERLLLATCKVGAAVPPIWIYEVGNALRTAHRAGRLATAARDTWRRLLLQLPVRELPQPHPEVLGDVFTQALTHQLTVYDASYLALAQQLRSPLATLDGAGRRHGLRHAAAVVGVPLVDDAMASTWAGESPRPN